MELNNKKNLKLIVVALIMMIGGSLLASRVNSNFGKTIISEIKINGFAGNAISAYLYTPKSIEMGKTAPAILAAHGMNNQKNYMANTALEFARRGFIVLNIDQPGHGNSTGINGDDNYGGPSALAYLRGLPNVDKNNIGLIGMSQGGFGVVSSAARAYPDGYSATYYMESEYTAPGSMDMTGADKLRNAAFCEGLVTELPVMIFVSKGSEAPISPVLQPLFNTKDPIVPNKIYGNITNGTARILYQPFEDHVIATDSPAAIGYAIEWMQQTLKGGNNIEPSNQIWGWKLFGTAVALLGAILFLFPFGSILLKTTWFKTLVEPQPEFRGFKGGAWWVGALITAAIGPLLYAWSWLHSSVFMPGLFQNNTMWPLNMVNPTVLWNMILGVITIVLLFISHYLFGKKNSMALDQYGIGGIGWAKILKSLLFAVCVIFPVYILVVYFDKVWYVDFRIWVVGLRPLNPARWSIIPSYSVVYAIYYVPIAMILCAYLRFNRGTSKIGTEMAAAAVMLVIGMIVWLALFYIPILVGGPLPWGKEVMEVTIIAMSAANSFPNIFVIPCMACILVYFFRKTGRIYTGVFIVILMVAWFNVGWNMFAVAL
ncbi:MAG: alpha/beta hydrolase [Treponema sp.]|jgi:pimeloyl-ACP methyl ester carboxylesterase|nr:alpha/beta hydrolase [Treponema sp.]